MWPSVSVGNGLQGSQWTEKGKLWGYFNTEEEAASVFNKAYEKYTGREAPNVIWRKCSYDDFRNGNASKRKVKDREIQTGSYVGHYIASLDHSNRKHSLLWASEAKRWLHCPPSAWLSDQFPNESSVYAAEGTFMHEFCNTKSDMVICMRRWKSCNRRSSIPKK